LEKRGSRSRGRGQEGLIRPSVHFLKSEVFMASLFLFSGFSDVGLRKI
jgi:hypothetical protein